MPISKIRTDRDAPDPDGRIRNADGVRVLFDIERLGVRIILGPKFPDGRARVLRDGQPVWSGSPVEVIGGIAIIYDPIPPLGREAILYEVIADSGGHWRKTLSTPAPPHEYAVITPRWAPYSAALERTVSPTPDLKLNFRSHTTEVPGDPLPASDWDAPTLGKQSWVFICGEGQYGVACERRDTLLEALSHGPVFFRPDPSIGFEQRWMLPTSATAKRVGDMWEVTVDLEPIRQPSMIDSGLVYGNTYRFVRSWGTYANVQDRGRYLAIAGWNLA